MRAVNLLPTDLRGASKATAERGAGPEATGGAGAFVVLGVLAAAVAGTAGFVLTDNTIKQRNADLTEISAQATALESQAAQLKPFADYDTMAKARVQTVRDLAGSRFDWEQALRDLSRAVPADVSLTSLTGDISTGAGGGGSPLRSAISAPAITLTGCAPGQTQVARLMARLNNIDGVTRVSLSRSVRRRRSLRPPRASTDELELRKSQPCGVGKPPSFEVVVFFEKDAAAVAATPTTSTGSVSATPTDPDRVGHSGRRRGHDFRFHHDRAAPGRGHPVSRTLRILIVAVVAFGAVGGYWKLVLAPKRAQVAELDQQIATQQAKLAQTQSLIATYQGAKDEYKANYATVARLGKAVPTNDDTRSLVVQLDTAAKRSNVDFDSININGGGGEGASVAPGAVNAGAFSAMPFSFAFTGDFSTLGDFFSRLERFVSLQR